MKPIVKTAWKYLRPNEMQMFLLAVCVVIALVAGISIYRKPDAFNGSLTYETSSAESKPQDDKKIADLEIPGDDDSGVRFTERVKEASGIGLGLSLYLVKERISNNRVLALQDAMKEFSVSELLPPYAKVLLPDRNTDYGIIQTGRGSYFIRYSPAPLKIEILSAGVNALTDGGVFIIRVPDTSAANLQVKANSSKVTTAGAWATIFEAPQNQNHYIPQPFAPAQNFQAMNWTIKPLQQTDISPERLIELNKYLQNQGQQ